MVFITEVESVYSAVRTESLYKIDTLRLWRVNMDSSSWSFEVTSADPIIKTISPTYAFYTAYKKLRDVHLRHRTQHPTTNEHF
jgi:hypothetical protein